MQQTSEDMGCNKQYIPRRFISGGYIYFKGYKYITKQILFALRVREADGVNLPCLTLLSLVLERAIFRSMKHPSVRWWPTVVNLVTTRECPALPRRVIWCHTWYIQACTTSPAPSASVTIRDT